MASKKQTKKSTGKKLQIKVKDLKTKKDAKGGYGRQIVQNCGGPVP